MRLLLVRLLICSLAPWTGCATSGPNTLSGPQLAELLAAVHPNWNPAVRAPLNAMTANQANDSAPRSATRQAGELQRHVAALHDAHVAVGAPTPHATTPAIIPVLPRWVEGQAYVDAATVELPIGTRLLAVQGIPIDTLRERLSALASVDGDRPSVRRAEAERQFASLSLRALGEQTQWTVTVQRPGAPPETLSLAGVGFNRARALARQRHSRLVYGAPTNGDPRLPHLIRLNPSHVVLRLAQFVHPDHTAYVRAVDSIFRELEGTETLILDLRGNEGGFRNQGTAVIRHLVSGPFTQWTRIRTRVKAIPDEFRGAVRFPIVPEEALTGFPGREVANGWVVEGDPMAARLVGVEKPHVGPLVVFIDDATNSAAVEMVVSLLAHRRNVRVIGTETQGRCDRHMGQLPIQARLESGLIIMFSLFEIELVEAPTCRSGRGIEPDEPLVYRLDDFKAGRDPYFAALSLPQPTSSTLKGHHTAEIQESAAR